MGEPHTFETWQDHDSIQEFFIKTRPICVCCGGRVLKNSGIMCMECQEKVKED